MADRDSAELFSKFFVYLADDREWSKKDMALELWRDTRGFDFSHDQMCCDEALIKLGLAVKCECGGIIYKGEGGDYHDNDECNPGDWFDFARRG